mmetsp:Transcript_23675/g.58536  ORF Transcript_23675/g.58536 Transcript_23675/m.58536 type:complete len:296 (-) Transcript_23675:1145-2032(-)
MQHLLNLEHVARSCVSAALQCEGRVLAQWFVDRLEHLKRRLHHVRLTLTEEEQPQCDSSEDGWPIAGLVSVGLVHQCLHQRLHQVAVLRAKEDQPQAECGHGAGLHAKRPVEQHRAQRLTQILSTRARVGITQTDGSSQPFESHVAEQVFLDESQRWIDLVTHTSIGQTDGHPRTRLDVWVAAVGVLVHRTQTLIDVPHVQHPDGRHCGRHAVVLVLVQPTRIFNGHKFVFAESDVDECVDEGGGQVLLGRVEHGAGALLLQMRLVHVLGQLRLHHIQLLGEQHEVAVELLAGGQ